MINFIFFRMTKEQLTNRVKWFLKELKEHHIIAEDVELDTHLIAIRSARHVIQILDHKMLWREFSGPKLRVTTSMNLTVKKHAVEYSCSLFLCMSDSNMWRLSAVVSTFDWWAPKERNASQVRYRTESYIFECSAQRLNFREFNN